MKFFIAAAITFYSFAVKSQKSQPYKDWLKSIIEIPVKDSICLSVPQEFPQTEDPEGVKKYVTPLYIPETPQQKSSFKYYFTGKVTSSPDYDIVLLYKYKYYSDSLILKTLYLVTLNKKDGKLLHFQSVAQDLVDRKDVVQFTSWFFKKGYLKSDGYRTFQGRKLKYNTEFSINNWGTIVSHSKSTAGTEKHEH